MDYSCASDGNSALLLNIYLFLKYKKCHQINNCYNSKVAQIQIHTQKPY